MARAAVVLLSHRPKLLPRAVRSVLRQTTPVQLVVQHDRDNSPGKFNAAVAATRSEFLVPLCDDDALHPTFAARCLEWADRGDIIFTDRRVWWSGWADWREPRTWVHRRPSLGLRHKMFGDLMLDAARQEQARGIAVELAPEAFANGSPLPMTCMIRRTLWDDLGGYDEIPHADTDLWYRAVKAGARVVYVPDALFDYCYHRNQISRTQPSDGAAILAYCRKHFADFGVAWRQRPDAPHLFDMECVPKAERATYQYPEAVR